MLAVDTIATVVSQAPGSSSMVTFNSLKSSRFLSWRDGALVKTLTALWLGTGETDINV